MCICQLFTDSVIYTQQKLSNMSCHSLLLSHMFGLDFNAADQLCIFPVIESQSIY